MTGCMLCVPMLLIRLLCIPVVRALCLALCHLCDVGLSCYIVLLVLNQVTALSKCECLSSPERAGLAMS